MARRSYGEGALLSINLIRTRSGGMSSGGARGFQSNSTMRSSIFDGSALVDRLDAAPGDKNEECQTKRKSLCYGAPIIRVIRSGEFDQYRRRMVETDQRADGQFKVLRLTSDTSFAAEFAAERNLVGGDRTSA
jgi:hypothetical protein